MKEIQGKSTLVRVSARFELARVRVIESQMYIMVSGISKINVCEILFLKHANCQVIELVRL